MIAALTMHSAELSNVHTIFRVLPSWLVQLLNVGRGMTDAPLIIKLLNVKAFWCDYYCRWWSSQILPVPSKTYSWIWSWMHPTASVVLSLPWPLTSLANVSNNEMSHCCYQDAYSGRAGPEVHPHSREGERRIPGPPDPDLHRRAWRLVHHHLHQHVQVRIKPVWK